MRNKLRTICWLAIAATSVVLGQGSLSWWNPDPVKVLKRELKDGKLILNMRRDEPHFYPEGTQVSVTVWQEVYGSSNGVVVLETNIPANYTPASSSQERIDWLK